MPKHSKKKNKTLVKTLDIEVQTERKLRGSNFKDLKIVEYLGF